MTNTCSKCILPSTYPNISFNKNNVCNYCTSYEKRWNGWIPREEFFLKKISDLKNNDPRKPIIVGLSGGKDSSYLLHLLVKKYHLTNIFTFTYDNGFLSEGAKANIELICSKLNLQNKILRLPNAIEKKLYNSAIKKKSAELCMFCMSPAVTGLINYAIELNSAAIVMGISPRTEPQFPLKILNAFDYRFFKDIIEPDICEKEISDYFKFANPWKAFPMFLKNRTTFINLAEYIDWNPFEITEFLKNEYNWVDYGNGVPHFDCMLEPLIDHFMYKRLGYSKVVDNISILVRRGLISREEALEKYEKEEVKEVPVFFIQEFCKRIGVNEEDFEPYLRGESLDYTHFKSNAAIIQKLSPILYILSKVGIIPDSIYRKYAIKG